MDLFTVQGLSHDFGGPPVLSDVHFNIAQGEVFGIIGPNGSGKSTLLLALSGLLRPRQGEIFFRKRSVLSYPRRELARQIAVLEQSGTPALPYTVEDVVAMGRYPWLKPFSAPTGNDFAIIEDVLQQLGLSSLRSQEVCTLSGGQRQLVSLARALVQEPSVLILDEPTTYLDIGHQMQVMEYVRHWHLEKGLTVVMVLHDLNLAGQFCDRLLLLDQGRIRSCGPVVDILTETTIGGVYQTDLCMIEHPVLGVPQILLRGLPSLSRTG